MGRKRKPKTITPWEIIHDSLAEIIQHMKVQKTTREYLKLSYYGSGPELRKHCIRILNCLDALDKEEKDGLVAENRWA